MTKPPWSPTLRFCGSPQRGVENKSKLWDNPSARSSYDEAKHTQEGAGKKTHLKAHSLYVIRQHTGAESALQARQVFGDDPELPTSDWLSVWFCPDDAALSVLPLADIDVTRHEEERAHDSPSPESVAPARCPDVYD